MLRERRFRPQIKVISNNIPVLLNFTTSNCLTSTLYLASELHSQLMTAESEMNNKMKEIQTLHSSLTEAMVSKERLEQRVVEFMEVSQHSIPDESLQARVQVSCTKHTRKRRRENVGSRL